MKITVISKEKPELKEIPYDEIKPGMVYRIKGGIVVLKLTDEQAVLLHGVGGDWFTLADGYKDDPATKILGKLTEIIVKEV